MFLAPFAPDADPPPLTAKRRSNRLVWQPRYDGVALVAYFGGRAIAGISGPWANQYALTWWDQTLSRRALELFDSIEAAQQAVASRVGTNAKESEAGQGSSWLQKLWPPRPPRERERSSLARSVEQLRRDYLGDVTDLSGLNFRASR